jgi:NAD(P)-dependent dehydrogenase (short-subunit alcohol dehydrogenase family)
VEGDSAIVNISSLSGMIGLTKYSAAKVGVVGLSTGAAAKELANHRVSGNAIQPEFSRTAITKAMPQKPQTRR